MPTASVKPSENIGSQEQHDPLNKVYLLMEKKIRNLEKRKNKLEHYREQLGKGMTLNDDQQRAVDAHDTVLASLDLCREFSTQIFDVMTETTKLQKLQLKKQQEDKNHHEYERIKQVLKIQNVLAHVSQEETRADFLAGNNGALVISEAKLNELREVHKLVTPCRAVDEKANSQTFKGQLGNCAENMMLLLDGKNKLAVKSTYREMKTLVHQIANCQYPKSIKPKETPNSVPSTPDSEPPTQADRRKSKKKKERAVPNGTPEVPTKQEHISPPVVPAIEALTKQSKAATRDSSASSSSTNGLPSISKVTEVPSLSDGPPPGLAPRAPRPAAVVAAPPPPAPTRVVTSTVSELTTPLVQQRSQNFPSTEVLPSQTFFNQSTVQPPPRQSQTQHPHFSMDLNDLVTSGRFNFLQESHVGQGPPDHSSVYIDPAVVSFGTIKPDSLVHLHEQQTQQKLSHSQPLHQSSDLASNVERSRNIASDNFVNQSISPMGPSDYSQNVPMYSQTSSGLVQNVSAPTHPVNQVTRESPPSPPAPVPQRQPARIPESSSWADQVASHVSQSNPSEVDDCWGDPVNGDVEDSNNLDWNDPIDHNKNIFAGGEFSATSSDDRRNHFRGGRGGGGRGPGGPRGGASSNGGGGMNNYRRGFGYQGGNKSSGNYGNSFRSTRNGPPSGGRFRGNGGGANLPRGGSRGGYRGRGGFQNQNQNNSSRGQF